MNLLLLWATLISAMAVDARMPVPIKGSTYRIIDHGATMESQQNIEIFTSDHDCRDTNIRDTDLCQPSVDRSRGEVRLAFQMQDSKTYTPLPSALDLDLIEVRHDGSVIDPSRIELTGHDARDTSQLYILLIDGSSSMYENDGEPIKKVYRALLDRSVRRVFYPPGARTSGVVLLKFAGSGPPKNVLGGAPSVIVDQDQYAQAVYQLGLRDKGYTHLYDAIEYAITDLLREKAITDFMRANAVKTPVIIALTDGFNNEQGNDTCGTNADRLERLLGEIGTARDSPMRPIIFTAGLGVSYFPNAPILSEDRFAITESSLCGEFVNERINGGLERQGIDNVSLELIARRGGAKSFVQNDALGLASIFANTVIQRYNWWTVGYRVDPGWHRKSFKVELVRKGDVQAAAWIHIKPNPWMDAPPPEFGEGNTTSTKDPVAATTAFALPVLGLFLILGFVGPALFNTRRAIFRRSKGKR